MIFKIKHQRFIIFLFLFGILTSRISANETDPTLDFPKDEEALPLETINSTTESTINENLTEDLSFKDQTLSAGDQESSTVVEETSPPQAQPTPVQTVVADEEESKNKKPTNTERSYQKNSEVKDKKIRSTEAYVQEKNVYKLNEKFKTIALNDVIEQGLRLNFDEMSRQKKQELNELTFESSFRSFWFPKVKLELTTGEQKIGTLYSSSRRSNITGVGQNGSIGFNIGEYTVFNWGKDYAQFLNDSAIFNRQKTSLNEKKRDLKHDLMMNYIENIKLKNITSIQNEYLKKSSFIYRLNKEKVTVGKSSQQDFYLARATYLDAQNNYQTAKISQDQADEELAFLIGENAGTKFIVNERYNYQKLKITLDEALELTKLHNSKIADSKIAIENNQRSLDIAQKENMPLPKFTMNLGGYKHYFGKETNRTIYQTESDTGEIELVASVNATWDVFGENGFLNRDKLKRKRVELELSRHELKKTSYESEKEVQKIYKNLLTLQNHLLILEARLPTVTKALEIVQENYLDGKAKFIDFKTTLEDYISTKSFYEQLVSEHCTEKLKLAKTLGIEDFPGENFELMVSKK